MRLLILARLCSLFPLKDKQLFSALLPTTASAVVGITRQEPASLAGNFRLITRRVTLNVWFPSRSCVRGSLLSAVREPFKCSLVDRDGRRLHEGDQQEGKLDYRMRDVG